jgi:hypothetical protein
MAIDGTTEDVADTPENVAAFGRLHAARGDSAFPQVKGVYLVECGTHAIVDAGFWPGQTSERIGGVRCQDRNEMSANHRVRMSPGQRRECPLRVW